MLSYAFPRRSDGNEKKYNIPTLTLFGSYARGDNTNSNRLRYEIKREFAPYIGVEWSKNFGNTADISPLNEGYVVGGVRV